MTSPGSCFAVTAAAILACPPCNDNTYCEYCNTYMSICCINGRKALWYILHYIQLHSSTNRAMRALEQLSEKHLT